MASLVSLSVCLVLVRLADWLAVEVQLVSNFQSLWKSMKKEFFFFFTDLGQCPPGKPRSRRNSIDLYTADYNIKLVCDKASESQKMNMMQRSSSHIRIDDIANSKLKLCPRCHSPHHTVNDCDEFGNLKCPRCLQWEHWEDSCPFNDEPNRVSFQSFTLIRGEGSRRPTERSVLKKFFRPTFFLFSNIVSFSSLL